jgi:predicted RNase H-like HicB family nuclease
MCYELIIYWSKDDESFVVEVPELPGCMADWQTYAEAVANAEIVIDEWIETARKLGRPIPSRAANSPMHKPVTRHIFRTMQRCNALTNHVAKPKVGNASDLELLQKNI